MFEDEENITVVGLTIYPGVFGMLGERLEDDDAFYIL